MKEEKAQKSAERVYVRSACFMTQKGRIIEMGFDKVNKLYFLDVDPDAKEGTQEYEILNFAKRNRV